LKPNAKEDLSNYEFWIMNYDTNESELAKQF